MSRSGPDKSTPSESLRPHRAATAPVRAGLASWGRSTSLETARGPFDDGRLGFGTAGTSGRRERVRETGSEGAREQASGRKRGEEGEREGTRQGLPPQNLYELAEPLQLRVETQLARSP